MADQIEWRPVVGFEGLYEVSSGGGIRRVAPRRHGPCLETRTELRPFPYGRRYRGVRLWRDGEKRTFLVHVLVARAFLGPCPEGQEVNHKRGAAAGDALDNLDYMTHGKNLEHAYRVLGRARVGAKLSVDAVRAARERRSAGESLEDLAAAYGVAQSTMSYALAGRTWRGG
jgi:hypothetical protein